MDRQATVERLATIDDDQLDAWVGEAVATRGRAYARQGRVIELRLTPTGGLVAWVDGSERYATRVTFTANALVGDCDCPYAANCKHAVAIVLTYQAAMRSRIQVPVAAADDQRLQLLDEKAEFRRKLADGTYAKELAVAAAERKAYVAGLPPAELVNLLHELMDKVAGVTDLIAQRRRLADGGTAAVLNEARLILAQVEPTVGSQDGYEGRDEGTSQFYQMQTLMERLLAVGQADDVVKLGGEIIERGEWLVAQSYDDSGADLASAIQDCLEIAFVAIRASSLSLVEQLKLAHQWSLDDGYGLTAGWGAVWEADYPPSAWSEVADRLMADLTASNPTANPQPGLEYVGRYRRSRLTDRLITALERANRSDGVRHRILRGVEEGSKVGRRNEAGSE